MTDTIVAVDMKSVGHRRCLSRKPEARQGSVDKKMSLGGTRNEE